MAFSFLRDALGLASGAAAVGMTLGMGRGKADRRAAQMAERQAALAEALADPNSPLFQQARQQAMEQSRTAQAQMLRDLMGQQARQARRFQAGGGTAFFARNPRRDEEISRRLMEMGQNEQAKADAAARAQLLGASQAFGAAGQGYGAAQQRQVERSQGLVGALLGANTLLGRIPQVFGQEAAQQSPVQGTVTQPQPQRQFTFGMSPNQFTQFGGR